MIDWTKPVETTETPPRPVRGLFDKDGTPTHVEIGEYVYTLSTGKQTLIQAPGITLRNVAPPKPCPTCTNKPCVNDGRFSESACFGFKPPKPEPVLNERWVNLHRDFVGYTWSSRELADWHAGDRVECRRIAWMSDGSPVPGEDKTAEYKADRDWLSQKYQDMIAERDILKAEIAHRDRWLADARAEVLRMKPVVDAAVAWKRKEGGVSPYVTSSKADAALWGAVLTYLSSPKKTAANVAKGPVKTCETCRWFNIGYHPDACKRCSIRGDGLQLNWEAKND